MAAVEVAVAATVVVVVAVVVEGVEAGPAVTLRRSVELVVGKDLGDHFTRSAAGHSASAHHAFTASFRRC